MTEKLIVAFKWLDRKRDADKKNGYGDKEEIKNIDEEKPEEMPAEESEKKNDIYSLVFCEISKSF